MARDRRALAARLDRAGAEPETTASIERGGAAQTAAADLAEPAAANEDAYAAVMGKVETVAGRLAELKAARAAAHATAHQAQVREALTRSELTLALTEALAGRTDVERRLRRQAALRLAERSRPTRRRHNRLSKTLDRLLARLGSFGQAAVIARSGLWRGTGRAAHDFRHMAAYARRRGDATVVPPAAVDQAWYLATYADVRGSKMAPLVHYLVAGAAEGRDPHPLFDTAWYARENAAALAATGVSPLEHFVREGLGQGRSPHPLFDVVHYLSQDPGLAPGEDPVSHYLRAGWGEGLSPHPLFDPAWYRRQAPRNLAVAPLVHYLAGGWRDGLSPHPLFDPAWYLEQYPDVAATGVEPLTHFVTGGGAEGRCPGPWFDSAHYMAARGEALAPGANPLVDYLQGGAWAVGEPRPGFPTAAYLAATPELVRAGLTPLEHWAGRAAR